MKKPAYLFAFALTAACLAIAPSSWAQGFPSKPVTLVNPYPPGGATDITARAIAAEMTKSLGQPVVVENRAGAAGNIGAAVVASAAPDGHTILLAPMNLFAVSPGLYTKLSYDPMKLAPIVVLTSSSFVLSVNPSVEARSLDELIALAKAKPGTLTFASVGNGSMVHLQGELLKQMAGIDIRHVPYKGAAPVLTDLIAGHVDMTFDNIPTAVPLHKAQKVRLLAVTGPRRDAAIPEIPTMAEAGLAKYEAVTWFGLAAPPGTPAAIVDRLNAAAVEGMKAPAFVQRMRDMSFDIVGGPPADMAKWIRDSADRWLPVVKASGVKLD